MASYPAKGTPLATFAPISVHTMAGRNASRNELPAQPAGLISVLLDQSAPYGDRSDAAMDLCEFDLPEAVAALRQVVADPTEDPDLRETCQESLQDLARRPNDG